MYTLYMYTYEIIVNVVYAHDFVHVQSISYNILIIMTTCMHLHVIIIIVYTKLMSRAHTPTN